MKRLYLDYQMSRPSWLAWGVLLCTLLLLGAAAYRYSMEVNKRDLLQGAYHRLLGNGADAVPEQDGMAAAASAELADMTVAVNRLLIPWDAVLSAVEHSMSHDVALLALDPAAVKRQITITAETRDMTTMLQYVAALSSQPMLEKVVLQKHEVNQTDPDHPVRFVVIAFWKGAQ